MAMHMKGKMATKGEMAPTGGMATKGGDEGDAKSEPTATPMDRLRETALRRGVNGIQSMGR